MRVTPQLDGSLWIEEPEKTAGFDMGNRSLFIKTNGRGDLNQIYFAHGAHAGLWKLTLSANGRAVSFATARAVGRLWELHCQGEPVKADAAVFMEEKMPAVYERLEFTAPDTQELDVEVKVEVDITAPPSPKGLWKHWVAEWLPRLPRYSWLWGWGMGRWLQTPAPRQLHRVGAAELQAEGTAAWQLAASQEFTACSIHGKKAELHFKLHLAAGEHKTLDLTLAESGVLMAREALAALPRAYQNAQEYAAWLRGQVEVDDALLASLYVSGLNASRAMFKEFPDGFRGLVAGPDYAFPPRIYFRDGYWTAQALIDSAPELVRAHLLSLAAGVHSNGQCPSGIFAFHLLKEWHAPVNCDADWLANHFDSPSFYLLLLHDYLKATSDWGLLDEIPPAVYPENRKNRLTVGGCALAAVAYLLSLDRDGDGLIEKPYMANDWADNIRRSTWVSYDQGLFIAALRAYADLCAHIPNGGVAETYLRKADQALAAMQRELWDEKRGYFVNYKRPDFTEANLSVDTLVTLYFHLLDEPQTQRILDAANHWLRAKNNQEQPWGDYGLLCAYPPYANAADLFDKSASPYWYHNGADWPYWDGMLAAVLLEHHDPRGLDVLTRWWQYSLEQGWLTPVEYYSPAFPVGGMLQGWSSMPAAALRRNLSVVKELIREKARS